MAEIKLLKSQKNSVFEIVRKNDLDPTNFSWEKIKSLRDPSITVNQLNHIQSDFFFTFDYSFQSTFSPGEQTLVEQRTNENWNGQINQFSKWVGFFRREYEAPDLWKLLETETELPEATQKEDNQPFSDKEKQEISSALEEVKKYLTDVQGIDLTLVEPRIKYLEDAKDRLGRKDWINILYSTIMTIVIASTTTPDSATEILRFVGAIFRQIFANLPLLMP
jgi:hypothetical protein